MRVIVMISLIVVAAFGATLLAQQAPTEVVPARPAKVDVRGASYTLGYRMGQQMKRNGAGIDLDSYQRGLQEGMAGKKSPLTEEQMDQVLGDYMRDVQAKMTIKNKQDGQAFLANNAKQPGVKTTKSGLQYKVIKDGTGKAPQSTDTVKTHYKGTFIDGNVFDSSYEGGVPVSLRVTGVIPGWTEALQMMKVGSKWQLFIPSELAYGATGDPQGVIPPNSALVFELELLGIEGQ